MPVSRAVLIISAKALRLVSASGDSRLKRALKVSYGSPSGPAALPFGKFLIVLSNSTKVVFLIIESHMFLFMDSIGE